MESLFENLSEYSLNKIADPLTYLSAVGYINSPIYENYEGPKNDIVYPAEEVLDIMYDKYKFVQNQIQIDERRDGNVLFICVIPDNDMVQMKIIKDMNDLGYFLSYVSKLFDSGRKWVRLQFEPKKQNNTRDEIKKYKKLYHVTTADNLPGILKHGLIMHSSDNCIDNYAYPDRIYLVDGTHNKYSLYKVAKMLYNHKKKNDEKAISEYALITIDMDKIPDDIPMYLDGNYEHGIFVENDIPANTIDDIVLFDCEKDKYIKYGVWKRIRDKILSYFR